VQRDEYFMDVHKLEMSKTTQNWAATEEHSYILKWTALTCSGTAPSKRSGVAVSLVNDMVVVFGGGTLWTDDIVHNDVHTLDLASLKWTRRDAGGPLPPPRQGHAALTLLPGTDILYMGGSNNAHRMDELFVLHTNSWQFSKLHHSPCPFSNLAGLTVTPCADASEHRAFVFGGSSWQDLVATVSSDVFLLDFEAGAGGAPGRRRAAAGAVLQRHETLQCARKLVV
jgi:hypothetical protein